MDFMADLEERLHTYDLAAVRPFVLAHMRPVLTFTLGEAQTSDELGLSRVGGVPDLPEGCVWPEVPGMAQASPMAFVAQINLAQAAPHDPTGLLPANGLLSFFFGNDEPSTHMPHAVLYTPEGMPLHRATPTVPPLYTRTRSHLFGSDAELVTPFHAFELTPRPGINIPTLPYAENELDRIADTIEDDLDAESLPEVYELLAREVDGNWVCKCFGYAEEQNGDLEYEAALRIHANLPYDCFKDSTLATLARHFGDKARAQEAVNNAVLLLEVRSDCHTGFLWGNTGMIHFFIDKDDLKALRFNRTFCGMYYS